MHKASQLIRAVDGLPHTGVTSEPLETTRATNTAITILTALAWYNVLELNFLIFNGFKRYKGLYFWSLLISSWGVLLHGLGFILKFFPTGTNVYLAVAVITIGWYAMVTGQSVVLYSRIHLVVQKPRIFQLVLAMIIVDAILFHLPTTVLTFGANTPPKIADAFTYPYEVMEKIQMTAFSIQETIISVIYAQAALKLYGPMYKSGTHKPMIELLMVNVVIIAMDVALLGVEYASLYDIEVIMKSLIYSIKLKLEFAVLTELKNYADPIRKNRWGQSQQSSTTCRRNTHPDLFEAKHPPSLQGGIVKTMSADVSSLRHDQFPRVSEEIGRPSCGSTIAIQSPRNVANRESCWMTPGSSKTELEPYPVDKKT